MNKREVLEKAKQLASTALLLFLVFTVIVQQAEIQSLNQKISQASPVQAVPALHTELNLSEYRYHGNPFVTSLWPGQLQAENITFWHMYQWTSSGLVNKTDVLTYPEQTADYIIFTDGAYYYAKNGKTGKIDFSGTDAATVINQAINSNTTIVIKQGTYYIKTPIQITNKYHIFIFFEDGAVFVNQQNDYAIKITSTQRTHTWIIIVNPWIYGASGYQSKGIYISYSSSIRIYNPHIENIYEGIRLKAVNTIVIRDGYISGQGKTVSGSAGIVLENNQPGDTTNEVLLQKLHIQYFQYGIYQPYLNGGYSEDITIVDCFLFTLSKAIYMTTPIALSVERNYFEQDDYGVYIDNSGSYIPGTVRILGNFFSLTQGAYNVYISNYCNDLEMDNTVKMGAGSVFIGSNVLFTNALWFGQLQAKNVTFWYLYQWSSSGLINRTDVLAYPLQACKYIVQQQQNMYLVKSCADGKIVYTSSDASTAIQYAFDNLTPQRAAPETVVLRGYFPLKKSVRCLSGNVVVDMRDAFIRIDPSFTFTPSPWNPSIDGAFLFSGNNIIILGGFIDGNGRSYPDKSKEIAGILVYYSNNTVISYTTINDTLFSGIILGYTKNAKIIGTSTYFSGSVSTGSFAPHGVYADTSQLVAIIGHYSYKDGRSTDGSGIKLGNVNASLILGCTVESNPYIGIELYATENYNYRGENALVVGNIIQAGTKTTRGILVHNFHGVVIANNVINGTTTIGISIELLNSEVLVTNNVVYRPGYIGIYSNSNNTKIINNLIASAGAQTTYFIYISSNAYRNTVRGNILVGTSTYSITSGVSDTIIFQNEGYLAPVATKTISASATTTIGPYGYPVQVILSSPSSATGVSLTRNGVTTSLPIQNTYYLYPGDTLSITEGSTAQTAYIVPSG